MARRIGHSCILNSVPRRAEVHTVIAFQERAFSNAETLFDGFGSTFCPFFPREIEARRA